jgi:phasin family protein
MKNVFFENFSGLGENGFDTAKRIGEINVRAGEKLLAQQFELAKAWLDTSVKSLELMGTGKTYQELLAGQAQIAQEYGQRCMEGYRNAFDIMSAAREALVEVVDEGTKKANEGLKATVKKAA